MACASGRHLLKTEVMWFVKSISGQAP